MDALKNKTLDFIKGLEGISEQILNDKEIMCGLIKLEPNLFEFVNENLKNDKDIMRATAGKAVIDYEKEQYSFKVELNIKQSLSEQEEQFIQEKIEYWREKKGLVEREKNIYYRKKTNDQDLGAAVIFANKLSKYPTYLNEILLINIDNYGVTRVLR